MGQNACSIHINPKIIHPSKGTELLTKPKKNRAIFIAWFFLLGMLFAHSHVIAQKKIEDHKDSSKVKIAPIKKKSVFKDSIEFYRKLEKLTDKRRVTRELFDFIFTLPPTQTPQKSSKIKPKKKYDDKIEGKIIRNIIIITLDPFGYDIKDNFGKKINFFEKAGNILHIQSRELTIKNHLLFKKGDSTDILKLTESERIIRSSDYVSDAIIQVDPTYISKDSLDIEIRVQDRWSIGADGGLVGGNYAVNVSERNFIGLGHQIDGFLYKRNLLDASPLNYRIRYRIPYIRNTFITAGLLWNEENGIKTRGINISRGFYSPLARWAGGIDIINYDAPSQGYTDSTFTKFTAVRYWLEDYWAGFAFPFNKNSSYENRITKFVIAGKIVNHHFQSTIPIANDPLLHLHNNTGYFINFGISQREYYKDRFIFKYGTTEDVPTGKVVSMILGYEKRIFDERYYAGIRSSIGFHLENKGYFSPYLEYGTYINQGKLEQGVINGGIGFISDVIPIRERWLLRQFSFINLTYGLQRNFFERINLNDVSGLKGFKADSVSGTNKLVLGTQTILFMPWQFLGFRFAPILYLGVGMIGNDNNSFLNDNLYPLIGVGLLIRNEYLIFNTFHLSIGYYPYIPFVGNHVFKVNPLTTNDFRFRDFEIGKPNEISYY